MSHRHGTRTAYNRGCRCLPCRLAESEYARKRYHVPGVSGVVDAKAAREHLKTLARRGVGLPAVHEATDISRTSLRAIRRGEQRRIQVRVSQRILATDEGAASGSRLVPARPAWKVLRALLIEGYSRKQLALWLGSASGELRIGKNKVRASTAARIEKLAILLEEGKIQRF